MNDIKNKLKERAERVVNGYLWPSTPPSVIRLLVADVEKALIETRNDTLKEAIIEFKALTEEK